MMQVRADGWMVTAKGGLIAVALAIALVPAASAHAATVRIVPHGAGSIDGLLLVQPACLSGTMCGDAHAIPFTTNEAREVDVDCPAGCSMQLRAEGWWAPRAELHGNETRSELSVWPSGMLRLTLKGRARAHPSFPVAVIVPRPGAPTSAQVSASELECVADGPQRWSCAVPATRIDLRVRADGFAPRYLFDIDVKPAQTFDVGTLDLVPGSSLSGWIVLGDKRRSMASNVRIEMATVAGMPSLPQRDTGAPLVAVSDRNGFFQFAGLAPGTYGLSAGKPGWSTVRVSGITIEPDAKEYTMQRTLMLAPLARIELSVSPQVTLGGAQWRVLLERRIAVSRFITKVAEDDVPFSGFWSRNGIEQGSYRISLVDETSAVRARTDLELASDVVTANLNVSYVAVRGTVTAGEEPLKATVFFSAKDGGKTKFATDDDGQFEGHLSHEGMWGVSIRPDANPTQTLRHPGVDVRRREDGEPIPISINLAAGHVRGTVVNSLGEPMRASVMATRGLTLEASCSTGPDGVFELFALEPGTVQLEATTETEIGTRTLDVGVSEDMVRIVVGSMKRIRAHIVTMAGEPVAGVVLRYTSNIQLGRAEEAVSGLDGSVTLNVPQGTTAVDTIVLAPGYPIRLASVPVEVSGTTPVDIIVGGPAGRLRVNLGVIPPWPWIRGSNRFGFGLRFLLGSSNGRSIFAGLQDGAFVFDVEPGPYSICRDHTMSDPCITRQVVAGQEAQIDTRPLWTDRERTARTGGMP